MSEPANKSIYTCSDSRKAREICWTTAILRKPSESLLPCKPFCALSGLHMLCFSLLFLAPMCTEPGFISFPLLSLTAVPTALPSACSPSYPVVSHPAPLCILISACFHPCSLSQTSPAILLTSHCILFYHRWLQPLPSSLSLPNLRLSSLSFPYYSIYSVIFSLHLVSSLCSVPVSALMSVLITFSEDPKPTHFCVDAGVVCLSIFYGIIHFPF